MLTSKSDKSLSSKSSAATNSLSHSPYTSGINSILEFLSMCTCFTLTLTFYT